MPVFKAKSASDVEAKAETSLAVQHAMPTRTSPPGMDDGLVPMSTYHYARSPLQRRAMDKAGTSQAAQAEAVQTEGSYGTRLSANLQSGMQALSGLSLDHVKVHYNSPRPGRMNALAYAQGRDIFLGQGQEKQLPHEAWHVVQQAQGRVRPTSQMKGGTLVNDDRALETEADVMGARALGMEGGMPPNLVSPSPSAAAPVVQGVFTKRDRMGDEEPAPALEVLAAERRLAAAGVSRSRFVDIRFSEEEVNLDDFMSSVGLAQAPVRRKRSSSPLKEDDIELEDPVEELSLAPLRRKRTSRPVEDDDIELDDPIELIDTSTDQPSAIILPELIAAYRADLIHESGHFLQEAEGNAIAGNLGVTARVMNQVSGPLIQSNGISYGNGGTVGFLLHVGGNHYIVIARAEGPDVDYVDTHGNGYAEVLPTVADGNCLIDGIHIIRHGGHASPQEVSRLRAVAEAGITDDDIAAIMSPIITDYAQGMRPLGLGSRTMATIRRDPQLRGLHNSGSKALARAWRKKFQPKKRPRGRSLEDEVTDYVLECNRLGEQAVRESGRFERLGRLWSETHRGEALPSHETLTKWIADKEASENEIFGSDTDSDSSDDELSHEDNDRVLAAAYKFTEEDKALLEVLNKEISTAKTQQDVEAILRTEAYGRFVVPQYRGIAYMTNRFGKDKRREHRKSSQLGLPVIADASRPEAMPREKFYTTEHGPGSDVIKNAKEIRKWLAGRRQPAPFADKSRRAGGVGKNGKNVARVFPTPFHALQSDYSEDYTKSAESIARFYKEAMEEKRGSDAKEEKRSSDVKGKKKRSADVAREEAQNQTYKGAPFRSHPFVSTADEARHAVRYALGNKPIAAEKGFRLRPRWHKNGKPQHPYSGKVYTSLHPLRDYLSPYAPSHVWSGRKLGALSINNHISKEGESSFLAMLKQDRVALEQVIRWPSLTKDKDNSGEFGLSRESRKKYRQLLKSTAPHSEQQKNMKAKKLGPQMESFFVKSIEQSVKAEAVRSNRKLIYRGVDGNFQATPPVYVTPDTKAQRTWRLPATAQKQKEMFDDIRSGKIRYGGLTEGYSRQWPDDEFYEELSDDDYARDDDRIRNENVEALVERLGRIRDETIKALQHLQANNRPAVSEGHRAAATRLARLAWRRITALATQLNIGGSVPPFPEVLAAGPVGIDDEQEWANTTEQHIDQLIDALVAVPPEVLRAFLNA